MEQHDPQKSGALPPDDPSALPPLFFEPEVDSDSQQNSEESTPPNSSLIPNPAERNEPKLSLSSYQSVTSGDITPTRDITPLSFQDSEVNDTADHAAIYNDTKSPEIISKQPKTENDLRTVIQKTSTPIRPQMDSNQETGDPKPSSKEKARTGNRVSFMKTDVIDPLDVRVPVTGYEIMEQRARFTVFKLHVHKGQHDNWFVFRRYMDFVHLQQKLKTLFPTFRFALPPKRWFRDNYERTFLEDRLLGLQAFIDSVLCDKAVCNSKPVQEFFCFNDPPGPMDCLEEARAYCESLEDAVYSLKKEVKQKDSEIDLLKEELSLYKSQVEILSRALREKNENGAKKPVLSPTDSMAECDHLAPEADQSQNKIAVEADQSQGKITIEAEIHQSEKRTQNDASQSQPKKQSPVAQKDVNHSRPLASVAH